MSHEGELEIFKIPSTTEPGPVGEKTKILMCRKPGPQPEIVHERARICRKLETLRRSNDGRVLER